MYVARASFSDPIGKIFFTRQNRRFYGHNANEFDPAGEVM